MPLKFNPISGEFDLVMRPGYGIATTSIVSDSGTATPTSTGAITLDGGDGLNTSATGNTVTVNFDTMTDGQLMIGATTGTSPSPATLTAGAGVTITNAANSITITAGGSVSTIFSADTGTANPALNTITMAGDATQGLVTSASGSTVTYTNTDASTSQKGVSELATSAETIAGSDTTRSTTAAGLEAKLGTITLNSVIIGGGTTAALKATAAMTNGMIPIGSTGATPVAALITGGGGVTVTPGAGSLTISSTGGGFSWNEETGTSATMAIDSGYIANNASLVTLTLPDTAAVGQEVRAAGKGAGLFKIAQNAGETIHYIATDTTTGTGGSLTAIEQYASIELVCITANTDWCVISSTGNFTIV